MSDDPWPYPRDTTTTRARRIANSLLAALAEENPARAEEYKRAAHKIGQTWLGARPAAEPGQMLTTAQAAEYCGVTESTIRDWVSRPHVPVQRYDHGLLDPRELDVRLAAQQLGHPRRRGHR